jgi:benzoyl-CoA reductase/2-hydroxyglutaryl-CoA dehydratase subunit BcrC/BadD/HgdB
MKRTAFERRMDRFEELKRSEAAGEVADSMDVRLKLIERMKAGELTLEQVQDELKRIKRNAKKVGKVTRTQAFRRG